MASVFRQQPSPAIRLQVKAGQRLFLAAYETGRNQQQFTGQRLFAAGNLLKPSFRCPLQLHGFESVNPACLIRQDLFHCGLIDPGIASLAVNSFHLAIVRPQGPRPFRPWIVCGPVHRRSRHHFQLRHADASLPQGSTHTVIARIAAADHNHVLSFCACFGYSAFQHRLRCRCQEVHCKHHALGIHMLHVQGAGLPRAAAQQHRVIILEFFSLRFGIQFKPDTLRLHQADPAFHNALGQLHVRNAVHQQSAGAVCFFNHSHFMPQLVQQVCRRQSGRAAANHGHTFSRARRRDPRLNPALGKPGLDQIQLIVFIGCRIILQVACLFAQCRTHMSCKFREGCRPQQAAQRLLLLTPVKQVVPLRNQVMQRAAEV